MKSIHHSIILLLCLPFFCFSAWTQNKFLISFWVDPIVPVDQFDQVYADIAAANFTVVMGGFGATTNASIQAQLDSCTKYNLSVIIDQGGQTATNLPDPSTYPILWGYRVFDEPSVSQFPSVAATSTSLLQAHPNGLPFINLLPNYASPAQLGADTYDSYVSQFMKVVQPLVLCVDNYPYMEPTRDSRDLYASNLATLRTYSLQYNNVPIWIFFNTMPYGDHYDVSEAQLWWQAFTALAYGAKGILYFCYWTPQGGEFPKGGAIITPTGTETNYIKGPHYYHAQRLNSIVLNFGQVLMKTKSTGVYRVLSSQSDPSVALQGCIISNLTAGYDYLVGQFLHEDGRTVVLLNNYAFAWTAWPTVTFRRSSLDGITEIDSISGREKPLADDSPATAGLQLGLGAAQARLFLVPN